MISVGQSVVVTLLDGSPWGWLGVISFVVFTYFVLRGWRVFWQIAIVLQILGGAAAPSQEYVLLNVLLLVAGLGLLLVPQTRRYFAKASAALDARV